MRKYFSIILFFTCFISFSSSAQIITNNDSISASANKHFAPPAMRYNIGNGKTLVYEKPKKFAFITNLPKDAAGIVSTTFNKKSIKPLLIIAGTTTLLLFADQSITDNVREFSGRIGVNAEEKNKDLLQFNLGSTNVSLLRLPANINTAFYQLGQGFPSLLIGLGLYTFGKIHHDYRALSTASQLAEAFILMGVSTQIVKRITGRQSPSESNTRGGNWHFLPSFSQFQKHTPNYDAFPSGHLATLMSSLVIFTENYPEKKWIKPVGYSLTGLVALAMINNKVHWASDYPLAIGMGYLCAKQVAKRNRRVEKTSASAKKKEKLDYTINYYNHTFLPGIIYKF